MSDVTIYTDGSCSPNPGPGGWAAILLADGREKCLSGNCADTTNNRMELTAAIEALRALKRPCRIILRTDSEYLRQGITAWLPVWIRKNWRTASKQPVKNQDLWQALHVEVQRHDIVWEWTRGHAGDPLNERADELARVARESLPRE